MKIEIDVNIWLDVLPFVPRRQLAEIVSQSDDYDFASILQYFLNRVGQIAFGNLLVSVNDENSMPIVGVLKEFGESIETYLPDGPMPGNIRDFQSITLSYFDTAVLNFLQQFHEKSLLSNVSLEVPILSTERLQQTLAQILPLLDYHIHSIHIEDIESFEHSHQQMLTALVARTDILSISVWGDRPISIDLLCRWLYGAEKGAAPRMLLLSSDREDEIIDRIRKDFAIAEYPVNFFIRLMSAWDFDWNGDISWKMTKPMKSW